MARGDREWAEDILAAIKDIRADTAGMDFTASAGKPVIVRSVRYSIAVIGEAAKNMGSEFKATCPEVPWRAISGMRDRIVHEHFRTNIRRIWEVVTDEIEPLDNALRRSISPPPAA
jgi:uncharacterized protein with HEPN domain